MRTFAYRGYRRYRRRARQRFVERAAGGALVALFLIYRSFVIWYAEHRAEIHSTLAWLGPLLLALVLAGSALAVRVALRRRAAEATGTLTLASIAPQPGTRSTGREFEELIAGVLRRDGARGVERRGGANDRGADVVGSVLLRERRWFGARRRAKVVVQCKHYAETAVVGSEDMQKFLGTVRLIHGADVAVFATTAAGFSAEARALARRGHVRMLAAADLLPILAGHRPLVPAHVTVSVADEPIGEIA